MRRDHVLADARRDPLGAQRGRRGYQAVDNYRNAIARAPDKDADQARELYKKMSSLWTDFNGWDIGVITSNEEFQENFGHKTSAIKKLKAGNLDTSFYIYRR